MSQMLSYWLIALFLFIETFTNEICHVSSPNAVDTLENPWLNQGLSFSSEQRNNLQINGLLPYGHRSIELQSQLIIHQLHEMENTLDKYRYLMHIMESNVKLFYHTLINNLSELMPIVYTPVVGDACLKLGYVLNKWNHGLWITIHDIGRMESILQQWPNKHNVKGIVVTDGQRILGLGDLGAFGMGIPIGKIALYTAIGGIDPSQLLPITLDVGTDNEELLNDPFYFGIKQKRSEFRGKYDALIDTFMSSVVNIFGESTLIQFEDFGKNNAFRLLTKYQDKYCTFNDDIQGTAAVTMAGIYASLKGKYGLNYLKQHTFLMIGAGSAGIGIADIISSAIVQESVGEMSFAEARKYCYLVDSKGLIFNGRKSGGISSLKAQYAHDRKVEHDGSNVKDIARIVKEIGATAIIGVSGQAGQFTERVIAAMKANTRYPLIFSLSNPTSKSECTAQEAYDWTNNELYFASGSPFELRSDTFSDRKDIVASQGNNAYIFPGVALGVIASEAKRVPNDVFLTAAQTLASLTVDGMDEYGILYPPIAQIRDVSIEIGIAVAKEIHSRLLTDQETPMDFRELVTSIQYDHLRYEMLSKL